MRLCGYIMRSHCVTRGLSEAWEGCLGWATPTHEKENSDRYH
ncbi:MULTISPECIES: hypothetical protein [Nostoc]|nr:MULTISPECIES: hypothetical protein [Nostoc]